MTRYCTCRTKLSTGFMIQCDRCEEWFHGKCINITKKQSKNIEKYYCDACRKSIPDLKIEYTPGFEPPPIEEKPINSTFLDSYKIEKKSDKKVLEKIQSSSKSKPITVTQPKTPAQGRKRLNQKSKLKGHARKQCANVDCIYESRQESKYCSDTCGYNFNKLRYEKHFIPRWLNLRDSQSVTTKMKKDEIMQIFKDETSIRETIKNLKDEKEELERNIKIIKERAKIARSNQQLNSTKKEKENDSNEDKSDTEDVEETVSGDASKTFCITCGLAIPAHQTFKHWSACHKKHESVYNFTADQVVQHKCEEDDNPKLYCFFQDKKTKRYCMHLESACPQHSNWHSDKDEVCGCPLNIMQKLEVDDSGGYCLELKKDCTQHYHWDKFRLAQMNMQRVQAFNRLDITRDKLRIARANFDDTSGGVVGIMLHATQDHKPKEISGFESPLDDDKEMIDVEMTSVM